ncbi:MAG: hypothetical protein U0136_12415 [Bdellovibrionota bacterium]
MEDDTPVVGQDLPDEQAAEDARLPRLLTYSIPLLLLVACVLIVGIARAVRGPTQSPDAAPPPVEELENPLLDCNHSMPLPFGMKARNQCAASCYAPGIDREVCNRGCDHLVAAEYARRITLDERSESQIASEIAAGCATIAKASSKSQPLDAWADMAKGAVRTFGETPHEIETYELEPAMSHYRVFKDLESKWTLPEGEDVAAREMAVNIRIAICLRQSIAASELALAEIADSFDFHSERWYRGLESALIPLSRAAELNVMNQYANVIHPPQAPQ